MTDQRKLPTDLTSEDWDKLLDDFERKTKPPPAPTAAEDAKAPPASDRPSISNRNESTAFYKPPKPADHPFRSATPQTKAPAPRPPAPAVPPAAGKPPAPRPPPLTAWEDEEEDQTVVGEIPRQLLEEATQGRGGGGGLGHLLKRPAAPPHRSSAEQPDMTLEVLFDESHLETKHAQHQPFADEDSAVVTSAPQVRSGPSALQRQIEKPPRARDAQRTLTEEEMRDPFASSANAGRSAATTDAAPSMNRSPQGASARTPAREAPGPTRSPQAATNRPSAALPPPPTLPDDLARYAQGPALLTPEQRQFSEEETTHIGRVEELVQSARAASKEIAEEPDVAEMDLLGVVDVEDSVPDIRADELSAVASLEPTHAAYEAELDPLTLEDPTEPLSIAAAEISEHAGSQWPNERSAVDHLLETNRHNEWLDRALWLETEARDLQDPLERARALLTVSELRGMAGQEGHAHALAQEALQGASDQPMLHRQARAHALRQGLYEELLPMLDAEVHAVPASAARTHGLIVAADVAQLAAKDPQGAAERMTAACQVAPSDPRPHVAIVATELASFGRTPAYHPPAAALVLAPLAEAMNAIAVAHGATENVTAALTHSALACLTRARSALGAGDFTAAQEALSALAQEPDLAQAGLWFAASLAAADPQNRATSLPILRTLQQKGAPGVLAYRAFANRAIELGKYEALREVLHEHEAFTDAERAALHTLLNDPLEDIYPLVSAFAGDPDLMPLASAVFLQASNGVASALAGEPLPRALVTLGRALHLPWESEPFQNALEQVATLAPNAPILFALGLEDALMKGRTAQLAEALLKWPTLAGAEADHFEQTFDKASTLHEGQDSPTDATLSAGALRSRGHHRFAAPSPNDANRAGVYDTPSPLLAAAALLELGGHVNQAISYAEQAAEVDPSFEAPVRLLLSWQSKRSQKALESLASAVDDPVRGSLLWLQAAVLEGPESARYEELLKKAHQADPELPFAPALGAAAARRSGDVQRLLGWIRARRETLEDREEAAYDATREAMLVADHNAVLAVQLLEQASQARPEDIALRDLLERLAPDALSASDRALSYATRADHAAPTDPDRARLALSAALGFEHAEECEKAAKYASLAELSEGGSALAKLTRERCDRFASGAARLSEELMITAREATDPIEEREAYEQLAYLDEVGRGDVASGLLWHRAILEKHPSWLPSLRRLEHTLIGEDREDELEPIATEIARATAGEEASAHAHVAARLRLRTEGWESTKELAQIGASIDPPSVWALRQLYAHGRTSGDGTLLLHAARALAQRTDRPLEQAALLLRGVQGAVQTDALPEARSLLEQVKEAFPNYWLAHLWQADVLLKMGDPRGSAEALEEAARISLVPEHQLQLHYDAALLWLDKLADRAQGCACLEAAAALDVTYADVFARLQALYLQQGEHAKLAALLEQRLRGVENPDERVALEVTRGRTLAGMGDTMGAKQALAAALAASPDQVDALRVFAEVCAQEGDYTSAEQAMIRLARLLIEPEQQVEIYLRLGDIYEKHLPNPERAELSYREVLKRDPRNAQAMERLVTLYSDQRELDRALEIQNVLLSVASNPTEKRRRTVELARIYEGAAGDLRKAETTLEALRKEQPNDTPVLRALSEFYVRNNRGPALHVLLDRVASDARRALTTGRFELAAFANLATVFELRGKQDAAFTANATLAALEGRPIEPAGVGLRAARLPLDDLIAPEILTPPFRALLRQVGSALDALTAVDLKGLRAAPIPESSTSLLQELQQICSAFQLDQPQLLVSSTLGPVCLPVSSNPATLVFGSALLTEPYERHRVFLALRACKILQGHTAALARTPPVDLWPLTAALLQTLAPSWQPQGVDANKLTDFRGRLQRALSQVALSPETSALALEVIGSLGNRVITLQAAVNSWGSRCALLALGDVNLAFESLTLAAVQSKTPPASGPERLTWVGRQAESRDLVIFSVSDAYTEARMRVR